MRGGPRLGVELLLLRHPAHSRTATATGGPTTVKFSGRPWPHSILHRWMVIISSATSTAAVATMTMTATTATTTMYMAAIKQVDPAHARAEGGGGGGGGGGEVGLEEDGHHTHK